MQQKKQQKQGKRQEWKDQMKESDRMLKGNVLLEKPQWVLMLTLAAEFLLLVVLHVLVNTFIRFCNARACMIGYRRTLHRSISSNSDRHRKMVRCSGRPFSALIINGWKNWKFMTRHRRHWMRAVYGE